MRLATPADNAEVLRRVHGWPVVGPLVEMHWRLTVDNPRMPHRFYLLDGGAVLKQSGHRATLCGMAQDETELAAFLHFAGIRQLICLDRTPPGWQAAETERVLVRPAGRPGRRRPPPGFDAAPHVDEVLRVLESTQGRMQPEDAREGFWADFMIRRNHGVARVYGVWDGGVLASTAGAYAITPWGAYIACVETLPAARRRGYAGFLVGRLCADLPERQLSLLCSQQMLPFYARLGFAPVPHTGYIATCPA